MDDETEPTARSGNVSVWLVVKSDMIIRHLDKKPHA